VRKEKEGIERRGVIIAIEQKKIEKDVKNNGSPFFCGVL
jgi:hypothetical protein